MAKALSMMPAGSHIRQTYCAKHFLQLHSGTETLKVHGCEILGESL